MIGIGSYLKDYLEYEGISQSHFAFQLGVTQKHLNSILNNKADLSVDLMMAIALLTDIDLNFILKIENTKTMTKNLQNRFGTEKQLKKYLSAFKLDELKDRDWVRFNDFSNAYQNAIDILSFLKVRNFSVVEKMNEKILYKENGNKSELLALWVARCDALATTQTVKEYDKKNIQKIVSSINIAIKVQRNLSEDTIRRVCNENGIYFVQESPLSNTGVDGAFKIFKGKPAIYLSTQKDVTKLVYMLYHELGHVKSDYNQGKAKVIVQGTERQEQRANAFAEAAMDAQL